MSNLERDVMYKPGATFFKEGDALMFRYQADSSSVIGPRLATEADKKAHGAEYAMYLNEAFNHAPLEAFDHDDSGLPGGVAEPKETEYVHLASDAYGLDEAVVYKPSRPTPKKRGRPPKV